MIHYSPTLKSTKNPKTMTSTGETWFQLQLFYTATKCLEYLGNTPRSESSKFSGALWKEKKRQALFAIPLYG